MEEEKNVPAVYKTQGRNFLIPIAIMLSGVIIASAILANGGGARSNGAPQGTENDPREEALSIATKIAPVSSGDHVRGNPKAPITVIEFSDFECPYCASFHPTMQRILSEYDGKVRWVYRHFPLAGHAQAEPAARASECVASLAGNDAFWEFADALFSNQGLLGEQYFIDLATKDFGITLGDFNECMNSEATARAIQDDLDDVINAGGQGTPYSVVMVEKKVVDIIPGALPYEVTLPIIERAISGAK